MVQLVIYFIMNVVNKNLKVRIYPSKVIRMIKVKRLLVWIVFCPILVFLDLSLTRNWLLLIISDVYWLKMAMKTRLLLIIHLVTVF